MKQIHIFVSGFVQGVGYRAFTRHWGRKHGLTGWVKNLPDRRVEAVIQGEEEDLKRLLGLLKKGPYFSQVKNIAVEWQEITERYEGFVVLK